MDIKTKISPEDFIAAHKSMIETASSLPSGRHVGHYKAAISDLIFTELHCSMMSIPYQVGFSPVGWRQVTDIMLEKKQGKPKVHRLCIIALMENNYNQANRILFARQLGHRSEDNQLVSSVQYGSRPGKLCFRQTK
jgi:hypothetical protein